MCGRYQIDMEDDVEELQSIFDELNKRYKDTEALACVKTGEIFPTDTVPVLAWEDNAVRAKIMAWGFPKWDRTGHIINARAETALQKPTFKRPLLERRVIVPTTGFFEWRAKEGSKKKDKFLFRKPNEKLLYLAGMYDVFPEAPGKRDERFTILTTAANGRMQPYHNRMPVLLTPDEKEAWLGGEQLSFFLHRVPFELEALG